jgi:hypothetical protein
MPNGKEKCARGRRHLAEGREHSHDAMRWRLREAGEALTARQVTERRLKAKGVSDVAPKDLRRLTASAQASLVNHEGKGLVRAVARA